MAMSEQARYKNLRTWNLAMGILHLVQGAIMFFFSKEITQQLTKTLPQIVVPDVSKLTPGGPRPMVDYVTENVASINLGQTISFFLFLSAIAHFLTITPGIYEWYVKNLKLKVNLIRWFEYALSSSLMIFVISILNGVRDVNMLFLIFSINACMNLFGAMMELHNSERMQRLGENYKVNWLGFNFGVFAGIVPWIVSGVYFFTSISRFTDVKDLPQRLVDILNLVKWIFPALFVFFNLFAINMFLQYKRVGKWKDYLFGEKAYVVLSLVAKSFLAWFIWGGTLR
jgi:hypothetical protein